MTVEYRVELKIECGECGVDLTRFGSIYNNSIITEPCPNCLEKEFARGHNAGEILGYAHGRTDGFNEASMKRN